MEDRRLPSAFPRHPSLLRNLRGARGDFDRKGGKGARSRAVHPPSTASHPSVKIAGGPDVNLTPCRWSNLHGCSVGPSARRKIASMNKYERSAQIWSVLVMAARTRQILTYALVGNAVGILPHHLGDFLEPIQSLCLVHGLPPLTAIVVQEATGLPGPGFSASTAVPASQMEVFAHPWLESRPPRPEAFEEALKLLPSKDHFDAAALAKLRGGE
jgi:hypothetical protein